jgi:hypothetical protein
MAMKPTDHEIASLYREGGASGPDVEVDREILKAARAAVAPKAARANWWTRWRLPLQAVATVCLVAMLTVMLGRREPPPPAIPPLALNHAAPATESRAPAPAPEAAATGERMAPQPPARARPEAKIASQAPAALPAVPVPSAASSEIASAPSGNTIAADAQNARSFAKGEAEAGAAPAAKAAARAAAEQPMPPRAWLDAIQLLIDQNRLEEARKRLEAFTKAYPDESVPEGIRARLKAHPEEGNAKQP